MQPLSFWTIEAMARVYRQPGFVDQRPSPNKPYGISLPRIAMASCLTASAILGRLPASTSSM